MQAKIGKSVVIGLVVIAMGGCAHNDMRGGSSGGMQMGRRMHNCMASHGRLTVETEKDGRMASHCKNAAAQNPDESVVDPHKEHSGHD